MFKFQERKYACLGLWLKYACIQKKFLRFQNITYAAKKLENNRFRVPFHFATKCFLLEKFPPPSSLLHPT